MFIASIVIPILIFYFYRKTKKEREKYEKEWLDYGKNDESAVLDGRIVRATAYKEKFYQNLYLHVTELWIDSRRGRVKAIKKEPARPEHEQAEFSTGEYIQLTGEWHYPVFYFKNRSPL